MGNPDDLLMRKCVIDAVYKEGEEIGDDVIDIGEMVSLIDFLPAAPDVVVPIRCKECKKWDMNNITGRFPDGVRCFCTRMSGAMKGTFTSPNDYCCWGERKEEDTND